MSYILVRKGLEFVYSQVQVLVFGDVFCFDLWKDGDFLYVQRILDNCEWEIYGVLYFFVMCYDEIVMMEIILVLFKNEELVEVWFCFFDEVVIDMVW